MFSEERNGERANGRNGETPVERCLACEADAVGNRLVCLVGTERS